MTGFNTAENDSWHGLFDAVGEPLDRLPDAVHAGAQAIVFNDQNEVLLQQRAMNGRWAPPAGGVVLGGLYGLKGNVDLLG